MELLLELDGMEIKSNSNLTGIHGLKTIYYNYCKMKCCFMPFLYPWSPFSFEFEREDTNKFMTLEMQA